MMLLRYRLRLLALGAAAIGPLSAAEIVFPSEATHPPAVQTLPSVAPKTNPVTYIPEPCPLATGEKEIYEYFYEQATTPASTIEKEFDVEAPRFWLGKKFLSQRPCKRAKELLKCVAKYEQSVRTMESAIPYASINDPTVLPFARKMAQRLFLIIEAKASQEVSGKDEREIAGNVDKKLLESFGGCSMRDAGCIASVQRCKGNEDCLGKAASRLREGLKTGNLREVMFYLYRANAVLSNYVSKNSLSEKENEDQIKFINKFVRERGQDWQLGPNVPASYQGKYILPRVGYGGDNSRMRDPNVPTTEGRRCLDYTDPMKSRSVTSLAHRRKTESPLSLIGLSVREKEFLQSELGVEPVNLMDQALPWWSGETCFKMKEKILEPQFERYNSFLEHARSAKIPLVSGVSGTTDSILALGRALGLKSRSEFNMLRAAALGWLVSERDHSVHEVMTASQSFNEFTPKYKFKIDYYAGVLPESKFFAVNVRKYFKDNKIDLPERVVENCLD